MKKLFVLLIAVMMTTILMPNNGFTGGGGHYNGEIIDYKSPTGSSGLLVIVMAYGDGSGGYVGCSYWDNGDWQDLQAVPLKSGISKYWYSVPWEAMGKKYTVATWPDYNGQYMVGSPINRRNGILGED